MSLIPFQIVATGLALPPHVQTNEALSPLVGRSPEWIASRTGVLQRHVAEVPVAALAAEAVQDALAAIDGPRPDLLINASLTPRQLIPDTSVFIQEALGWSGVQCFSLHATCLSFLPALRYAGLMVSTGQARRVVVVSAETGTISRNLAEPESAVLIGDGAGAVVVEAAEAGASTGLTGMVLRTFPEAAGLTTIEGAGTWRHPNHPDTRAEHNLFHMEGPKIYRFARKRVRAVLDEALQAAGTTREQVDLVVPHQASGPALDVLGTLGLDPAKVVRIVETTGNCIAASLPMALATAKADGRLQTGQTVLFVGTGAGLSIGAAILRT